MIFYKSGTTFLVFGRNRPQKQKTRRPDGRRVVVNDSTCNFSKSCFSCIRCRKTKDQGGSLLENYFFCCKFFLFFYNIAINGPLIGFVNAFSQHHFFVYSERVALLNNIALVRGGFVAQFCHGGRCGHFVTLGQFETFCYFYQPAAAVAEIELSVLNIRVLS